MRLPLFAFGLALFSSAAASAATSSAACSGVRIDAEASCEHRLEIGCGTSCDPRDMLFACAAELAASCQAGCDLGLDLDCKGGCDAQCEARCAVEEVECDAECADECADGCVDACLDAEDPAQCRSSCEATCDVECDDACGGLPPDADCVEHCEECCFGACSARANFDCQADAWAQCEIQLLSECEASCGIDGAVYCDGQYVAGGDDTLACTQALEDDGHDVETDVKLVSVPDPRGFCTAGERSGRGGLMLALGALLFGLRRRRC